MNLISFITLCLYATNVFAHANPNNPNEPCTDETCGHGEGKPCGPNCKCGPEEVCVDGICYKRGSPEAVRAVKEPKREAPSDAGDDDAEKPQEK